MNFRLCSDDVFITLKQKMVDQRMTRSRIQPLVWWKQSYQSITNDGSSLTHGHAIFLPELVNYVDEISNVDRKTIRTVEGKKNDTLKREKNAKNIQSPAK